MSIERLSLRHRVKSGSLGPATEALSREELDRLVDDVVSDLTVLKLKVTPDNIRDYVENNVRINVDIGRYLAPSASDLEDALGQSRLEAKCAEHVGADADEEDAPKFGR
ncbi:hypothetical protein [Antarcticirhabdus aurantiaca]|uniref:Uncharacterized protein n=1 Tax=Antarcticirhabdus aurantiaca TaxID=2606717 RepID=A0ACD4NR36_9HYPH|nr:hypothetical protein [Antarcticirhabdus aurantiaca]WAJ29414.1 hypothetical protein OXU80_04025 [Jeongeuplla avenae]